MADRVARLEIDDAALNASVMGDLTRFTVGFVRTAATTAQSIAPVRTGYLRSQIRADDVNRVGPWSLASGITSGADYSAPVHEGARPHVIRPKNARALRFMIGERVVFAMRVNHPGNQPNPYLRNAVHRTASADPRIQVGDSID